MNSDRWANVVSARRAYEGGLSATADGPLEAFFEVSARCNLHCQMCAINYDSRYLPGSRRPSILTPELFRRLEPAFPTLLRAYLFGLGEPTLNPHLVDYIRELSAAGAEVWFNTNATLIDDAKAEALAAAGATAITVSIDGATAATYERIRVGASFEAVVRGIRALVRASRLYGRPRVDLSFVAMSSNLHELPTLVDLAADLGAGGIHVEPLYSQQQADLEAHYGRENLGRIGTAAAEEIFASAQGRARDRGVRLASRFLADSGTPDYVERARSLAIWWTCTEPWTSIWVTSAGEVRTCCINETSFGNLFDSTFEEIWNGPAFAAFRRQHACRKESPTGCANCQRNGRIRHSPYLAPLEPVTYRPLVAPSEQAVEATLEPELFEFPAPEATLTDPLVLSGTLPAGDPGDLELTFDKKVTVALNEAAVCDGRRFAATLAMPYLTEGAHLIEVGRRGSRPLASRVIHLWRPEAERDGATLCVSKAAFIRTLPRFTRRAAVLLDGRKFPSSRWLCQRRPDGPVGIASIDLSCVAPGCHRVVVAPRGHSPVSYDIVRLPE